MKKAKRKTKTPDRLDYTHRDASGMRWRMVGARPVSELADKVMKACGLSPRKDQ